MQVRQDTAHTVIQDPTKKKKNQSGPDPSQQPSSTGVLGYSYPDDLLFRM